jgi:hypothetical protein
MPRRFAVDHAAHILPAALSVITAESGIVADLCRRDNLIEAAILDLDPNTPVTISSHAKHSRLLPAPIAVIPVEIAPR